MDEENRELLDNNLAGDLETESIVNSDTDTEVETIAETETESSSETEAEIPALISGEAAAGEVTEVDTDIESSTEIDTETDADVEPEAETDTEPVAEIESDTDTDTDTEADTEADTESDTEVESDTEAETDAEAVAETDTDMDTESETDTDTDTDMGMDIGTDVDMGTDLGGDSFDGSLFETIDLTDMGDQTVRFTVDRDASFENEVGFYEVNEDGSVVDPLTGESIAIGEAGYADAALANSIDLALSTPNGVTTEFTTELAGGTQYGTFIVAEGTIDQLLDSDSTNDRPIYFGSASANPENFDHIITLDENTFGYEDFFSGGDNDFNDMVVSYEFI